MKKAKKLGLQSLALVLMAFVLVAGVAFGMTGAWFAETQNTGDNTVTFATGVHLTVNPTDTENNRYFVVKNSAGTARAADALIFPGDTIKFDATFTNTHEAAYVMLKYEISGDSILKDLFNQQFVNTTEEGKITLAHDATTKVTKEVELTGVNYTNDNAANKTITIKVTAYAIQQENYATGNWAEVWSEVFTAAGLFA